MNIKQKMELLKLAIERGAVIDITFYSIPSMHRAEQIAEEFECLTGVKTKKGSGETARWLKIDAQKLEITFFYDADKQERIDALRRELQELEGA